MMKKKNRMQTCIERSHIVLEQRGPAIDKSELSIELWLYTHTNNILWSVLSFPFIFYHLHQSTKQQKSMVINNKNANDAMGCKKSFQWNKKGWWHANKRWEKNQETDRIKIECAMKNVRKACNIISSTLTNARTQTHTDAITIHLSISFQYCLNCPRGVNKNEKTM